MSYSRGSWQSSCSRYRSRSRSVDSSDIENPGNNLYVTGLSARVRDRDLEKHFSTEGEVIDASIVLDPWTRESRGFGFVTMGTVKEADRCIKYLDRSVLEGRVITVEKAKRRRGRTPTPGRYLGTKSSRARRYSPSYSPVRRDRYSSRYSPERESYSPVRRYRYSSRYSPEREESYSPYGRGQSYSPYERHSSYSPYERRRSYSPYGRRSYSPYGRPYSPYGRERSYSPYDRRRSYSPYGRHRSYSPYHGYRRRSRSPYRYRRRSANYSRRYSSRGRRGYSSTASPQKSYSRSCSPELERSVSCSTGKGYGDRKPSHSRSSGNRHSRESYAHSRSSFSRSVSRERRA